MYVNPDQVAKAKSLDLFTYLSHFEPDQLKRVSRNCYCTKEHDSLKISVDTGLWHWFSHRIGGKTALDYLIKVQNYSFPDAVEMLNNLDFQNIKKKENISSQIQHNLIIPKPYKNNERILHYLTSVRKIDREILNYFISAGLIYEEREHHNVVFLGFDQFGKVKYAYVRGTGQVRFHSEIEGSDKRYSFSYTSNNKNSEKVHLFESVIDLLSFASLVKMKGQDWKENNYLSLGGIFSAGKGEELPMNLNHYLYDHLPVNTIHLHLDNDETGRKVSAFLSDKLSNAYKVLDEPPRKGKDFNEYLCNLKSQPISR